MHVSFWTYWGVTRRACRDLMTSNKFHMESEPFALALRDMTSRYERLVHALSVLRRIDELDDPSIEADELFRRILETIAFGLAAENCSLMLVDETGEFLELRAACGVSAECGVSFAPHAWHGHRFRVGEGVVGKVAKTGHAIRINDVTADGDFVRDAESPIVVRSLLCFPLGVAGKVTGVLNLSHSETAFFSIETENTLAFVAERIARLFATRLLEEELRASEVQHRVITENANDPILLFNVEGAVVSANAAATHLLGVSPERLQSEPNLWESRVHAEDSDRYLAHRQHVLAAKTACTVEYRCAAMAGEHRHIEQRSAPMLDASGRITGIVAIARDVTDRKRVEQLLQEHRDHLEDMIAERSGELLETNEALLRDIAERKRVEVALEAERRRLFAVLEIIPAFVCLLGEDFGIQFANGRFRDFFGDPSGKHCYDMFLERGRPCDTCPMRDVLKTGAENAREWTSPKGRIYLIYDNFFAGEKGTRLILKVGIDITEEKKAEEERRSLDAQVQHVQKLESLGVLAGGIAHDFNNLLMAIVGNAELILAGKPQSRTVDRLNEILGASKRAADLCGQMLAFSGAGKYIVEKVNLDDLVREMMRLIDVSISKKITLQHRSTENLPPINADGAQIRQVVMSLISNASEAMRDNPGLITIATGSRFCDEAYLRGAYIGEHLAPGTYVYIEVADTGCGMNQETMAKMFEPFFSTKFMGRGLGLAAVLGIVRGHQGTILVKSAPGQGTSVCVLFPCPPDASTVVYPR